MDTDEELVPEGSVKDAGSVKGSEISLMISEQDKVEPKDPKPASFSPVFTPDKDDSQSLKSAQSEGLSGDSHRVLSPMPKTLAGSSVKEFPLGPGNR